jgi:hypothetical protein
LYDLDIKTTSAAGAATIKVTAYWDSTNDMWAMVGPNPEQFSFAVALEAEKLNVVGTGEAGYTFADEEPVLTVGDPYSITEWARTAEDSVIEIKIGSSFGAFGKDVLYQPYHMMVWQSSKSPLTGMTLATAGRRRTWKTSLLH